MESQCKQWSSVEGCFCMQPWPWFVACVADVEALGLYLCLCHVAQDEVVHVVILYAAWYLYHGLLREGQQKLAAEAVGEHHELLVDDE